MEILGIAENQDSSILQFPKGCMSCNEESNTICSTLLCHCLAAEYFYGDHPFDCCP